jgi:hypothetical protein
MKVLCPRNPAHLTSSFSSRQEIYCHDCAKGYPWPLKDGQPPIVTSNRDTRGKV